MLILFLGGGGSRLGGAPSPRPPKKLCLVPPKKSELSQNSKGNRDVKYKSSTKASIKGNFVFWEIAKMVKYKENRPKGIAKGKGGLPPKALLKDFLIP